MAVVIRAFNVIAGTFFGLATMIALSPALAAFDNAAPFGFVVVAIGALLGLFAPTIRRAFGRGFLLLGVSVLALPLSTMLLSGRAAHEVVSTSQPGGEVPAAIGAGLAGIAFTGVATFIGFFLGAILIVIGLVLALGGRREVVIVQSSAPKLAGKPSRGRIEPTL